MDGENVMDITYKKIVFAVLFYGIVLHAGHDLLYQQWHTYKSNLDGQTGYWSHEYTTERGWKLVGSEEGSGRRDGGEGVYVFERLRIYQIKEDISRFLYEIRN